MKSWIIFVSALLFFAPLVFADHNININTADQATLEMLTGIGPSKAQAIIDYRTQHGPFETIDEINNVSGIGPATYESIKDHITVQGGNSTPPAPAPVPSPATPSGAASPPPSTSSQAVLTVDGGSDRVVIAGADAQFAARAYSGKAALENATFVWNFGDGSTASGAHLTHRFEYPGRYAVVLTGSHDGSSASDNFSVTAEEAKISLRVLSDGGVEVENLAARDVDLSRWMILSKGQRFTFPENSLVLGKQSMRISPATLHFYASDSTELAYPNGALAFTAGSENSASSPAPSPSPLSSTIVASPPAASVRPASAAPSQTPKQMAKEVEEIEREPSIATTSQLAAAGTSSSSWPWWLGAASISIAAAGAIFVSRRFGRKEWDIIDESLGGSNEV